MAYLRGFGSYLPARVVPNAELAPQLGVDPDWILARTGIQERRYAAAVRNGRLARHRGCPSAASNPPASARKSSE